MSPDFLIIGGQRCGTTSLFEPLSAHPDVAPPPKKEIHYFDLRYWRGKRWYARHFRRPAGTMSGESSPYYLYHPHVPERVAADLPGIRIVALLRDPIDRAWSQHQMNRQTGRDELPFLEALAEERTRTAGATPPRWPSHRVPHRDFSYAAKGDYVRQLDRWFAAVDPETVLLVRSVDLFERPEETHGRILAHIGLSVEPLPTPHRNRGPVSLDPELRAAAAEYFHYDEDELIERYGIDYGRRR